MRLRLTIAATLAATTIAGSAAAQQAWLQDRRYGQGIGLRAGNLEFHPSLAAELGYDSNYFQRAKTERPIYDAWRLRVTPSLTLSTLKQRLRESEAVGTPPAVSFSLGAFLAYNELFGSDEVSSERHFDAGVGGRVDLLPSRPVGFDLYADYLRSGEPSNAVTVSSISPASFDRGSARGGLGATWRPGGGLFEWRLGYEAAYNYFEDKPFDELNNLHHNINTRGRWRFLPRTALIYQAGYSFIRYTKDTAPQPNGDVVEARVGLNGLITNRFAFQANVGWNSSFYERGDAATGTVAENYDGYVMGAQLKYFLIPTATAESAAAGISSIGIGYQRDFSNSYLGSFYVRDYGFFKAEAFLAGMLVGSLQLGASRYSYPLIDANNPGFEQTRLDGQLFLEYRFSDTFGVNTSVSADHAMGEGPNPQGVFVGNAVGADGVAGTGDDVALYDNLEYTRIQACVPSGDSTFGSTLEARGDSPSGSPSAARGAPRRAADARVLVG
jgi:hypothetical protein